jgi:predicted AlkP superfamily pyrophosphatase or phosphodiesterase
MLLATSVALLAAVLAGGAARGEPPRLAVLITVDQLRRDRLDASLPGGLGRLVREGRSFANGELAHAVAQTCPGHAALATGRHPAATGLAANYFVDRESGVVRYCVEDEVEAAAVLHSERSIGRSPRRMRTDGLGDWLQIARPGARVLAISPKDRSAIALGGQHPSAAYWLIGARDGVFGFSTSRYYAPELPSWVRSWNGWDEAVDTGVGLLARVPEQWVHGDAVARAVAPRPDDYPHEEDSFIERSSPHALRGEESGESAGRIGRSPWVDALTLDFAAAAAQQLGLGDDAVPDLLAISLSGTDAVGHEFGPESHEARDALLRLDDWLDGWLAALEARVGRGRVVVALSSDHGVLPLPEWLHETGRGRCPVEPGRISLDALREQLGRHLQRKLGGWFESKRSWLRHAGLQITVDRANAAQAGVEVERVIDVAEGWLERRPAVAAAWTAAELASAADPMAQRYRRSHDPQSSGDLAIQPADGCLISRYSAGTSHGTPYDYDRDVPIVFWGPGVEPGRDERPAATVDVAPTLAELLGVPAPDDLDGASLLD